MSTAGGNATATANASNNTQTLVANGLASEALAYCQYTESVMLTECRKNNYQRALLQIEMAESTAYDHTRQVMSANAADRVTAEGISAFLQKRDPNWPVEP